MYFSVLFTTGIKTPSKGVSILSILSWQRYHGLRVCSLADEERDDLGAALDQVPEVVEVPRDGLGQGDDGQDGDGLDDDWQDGDGRDDEGRDDDGVHLGAQAGLLHPQGQLTRHLQ